MAPTHSIAFCNNRGGVGKTFMTFQTACEAARARPDKKVLVIDLSLYGNVTTLLLGGSSRPPEAGGDTIGCKQTMEMVPTTDMRIEGLIHDLENAMDVDNQDDPAPRAADRSFGKLFARKPLAAPLRPRRGP